MNGCIKEKDVPHNILMMTHTWHLVNVSRVLFKREGFLHLLDNEVNIIKINKTQDNSFIEVFLVPSRIRFIGICLYVYRQMQNADYLRHYNTNKYKKHLPTCSLFFLSLADFSMYMSHCITCSGTMKMCKHKRDTNPDE